MYLEVYACSATGGQTHTIVFGARGQRRERSIDIMTRASACMRACTIRIMCALHTVLLLQPATAQELCRYANDGECDEPAYCNYGTDSTDCGGSAPGPTSAAVSCAYANDGVCKSSGRVPRLLDPWLHMQLHLLILRKLQIPNGKTFSLS